MQKYISFSGGVESTTMCILYGKGSKALWVDTGAEHEKMYERINNIEKKLIELHDGDFELIRLKGYKKYKGIEYFSLIELIKELKVMPSQQMRFCTTYFKIQPIDEFLSNVNECELMIGFNYDEQGRTGNIGLKKNIKYTYPLMDDGYTRNECEEILNNYDMHPNFPIYMLRGGCKMCFFKSQKEYKAMYFLNRDEFNQILNFENSIQDKRKKFYSIMGNGKSLEQLKDECEIEKLMFDDIESFYKSINKETSCGAFCNR